MATNLNAAGNGPPAATGTSLHQLVQVEPSDSLRTRNVSLASDSGVVQDEPVMPGPRKVNRQALTIRIDRSAVARLKATAKDAAGKPFYIANISDLVERAVIAECDRIDAELAVIFGTAAAAPAASKRVTNTLARGRLPAINCDPAGGSSS